jgi:hypothetical protein
VNGKTPLHLRRRGLTILACVACLAALWGLAQSPAFVDIYARTVGARIARGLSAITGVVPMSLAEILIGGALVSVIVRSIALVVQAIRGTRRLLNALAAAVLPIATAASVVVAFFYLAWGLNYARAPLADRLGWPPIERPADDRQNRQLADEIAGLAGQLVDATNANYRQFAGRDDLERPSVRSDASPALDAVLESAYAGVQRRLGLEPAFAAARGRAKPIFASELMNELRLGGFYFPWTGEANYNRLEPASTLPHTIAHEKAHQRGIALEDEANFIGYLVCITSDDPYARYSGYLFAQRQLLNELAVRDLAGARALIARRLAGVQRDVDFSRAFWARYEGAASRVSERVNNTYLRSQGERRGTAAYAASKSLIVLFARHNGGSAVVAR